MGFVFSSSILALYDYLGWTNESSVKGVPFLYFLKNMSGLDGRVFAFVGFHSLMKVRVEWLSYRLKIDNAMFF
jgi:hypothetical protein